MSVERIRKHRVTTMTCAVPPPTRGSILEGTLPGALFFGQPEARLDNGSSCKIGFDFADLLRDDQGLSCACLKEFSP